MPDEWGQRWLAAVGADRDDAVAERLGKGRYHASRGKATHLEVTSGRLTARVPEGRLRPRRAAIEVPPLSGEARESLVDVLASEVRFLAAAMEGHLPGEVVDVLRAEGVALVPDRNQIVEECTCGEVRQPCKHVATLHHAFADLLDEDPLPLLELRGQDPHTLVEALRERRRGEAPPEGRVTLEELEVGDVLAAQGDLDALPLQPRQVEDPAWLFEHLGTPPGVDDPTVLARHLASAADFAWRIAAGAGSSAADEELLLAELRAQRMAGAAAVAEGLGWGVEQTTELLDELFHEGRVLRMGSGENARYRAAS